MSIKGENEKKCSFHSVVFSHRLFWICVFIVLLRSSLKIENFRNLGILNDFGTPAEGKSIVWLTNAQLIDNDLPPPHTQSTDQPVEGRAILINANLRLLTPNLDQILIDDSHLCGVC